MWYILVNIVSKRGVIFCMGIVELVGKTPLLRLAEIERRHSLKARVYAKLEMFNPSHSIKDRTALFMLKDAERNLDHKSRIITATSGNFGISLAMLSSTFGYKAIVVMPENMPPERQRLIRAYGGDLVLTDGAAGMAGSIERAEGLLSEMKNAQIMSQFTNRSNVLAHFSTTGPEIYRDIDGNVDILIAGVGTAGTLMGTAEFLKKKNPSIEIIAVEPAESPVISGGVAGQHQIWGIGAGFLPPLLDASLVDRVITVDSEAAVRWSMELRRCEGIFVGVSSGAVLSCAVMVGRETKNKDKQIAIIFPDGGEKYLK